MKTRLIFLEAWLALVTGVLLSLTGAVSAQQTQPVQQAVSVAENVKVEVVKTPLVLQSSEQSLDPKPWKWKWVATFRAVAPQWAAHPPLGYAMGPGYAVYQYIEHNPDIAHELPQPCRELHRFLLENGPAPLSLIQSDSVRPEEPQIWEESARFPGQPVRPGTREYAETPVEPTTREALPEQFVDFEIAAPTAEQAEAYAKALIMIYDKGIIERYRKLWPVQLAGAEAELPKLRARAQEAEKTLAPFEVRLRGRPEIDKDSLAALQSKMWQLQIDQYGLGARIKTTEKLLKEATRDSIREHLENLRVNASIEKAELEARVQWASILLAESADRQKILDDPNYQRAKAAAVRAGRLVEESEQIVTDIRKRFESPKWRPMQVLDDKITIHPIEWLKPPALGPGVPVPPPIERGPYGVPRKP